MSGTTVKSTKWRLVEVGRVVLINKGPDAGKLATIVEIIDHKRALIDGPTTNVARKEITLGHVVLTPLVVDKLPRGARSNTVAKYFTASDIINKWKKTSWAKKISAREARANLSDFDRFKVLVLKKQRRYAVNKAAAKH